VRSLVSWPGPEHKQTRHDCPRPHALGPRGQHRHTRPSHAQRQARPPAAVVLPPVPIGWPVHTGRCGVSTLLRTGPAWRPQAPAAAWGVSGARPCWRPRTRLGPASCPRPRAHGRGVVGWRSVRCRRRVGVSWRAWGRSSVAGRRGRRRGPCWVPAVPGTPRWVARCRAVVPGTGAPRVWSPEAVAVSAAVSNGPPGGARVGGGGRCARRQGPRVGPQQPNKGLQATPSSLRSCLAPASGRA